MKEKKQYVRVTMTIITFTVLLIYFVNHTSVITGLLGRIVSIIFPFLIGCGIAFVLNIPLRNIESGLFKDETKKIYKAKRAISIVLTYLIAVAVLGIVITVVAPEVGDTITKIKDKLPAFIDRCKDLANKYMEKYPELNKEIQNFNPDLSKISNIFVDNGQTIISTTVGIFSSIVSAIVNTLIGIVFSVYILAQKEKLGRQAKMICYAIFKESTADEMMIFGKIAHTTFAKFFTCQFREGFILGSMFVVTMLIIKLPYALTIGVIIAFTALIPVFGAFMGLFIGSLLILVDSPSKVIVFIIMFFVLQNIENYLIYPRLVGGGVGLPPIWVLLAVLMGGDLMGVVGMFVFIPLVSVIYAYVRSIIYRKLKHRQIDVDDKIPPDDVIPLMENRRTILRKKKRMAGATENTENSGSENTNQ